MTDADGHVTAYAYDGLDRSWRTCYQTTSSSACAGSPADYEQLGYDANGNVTSDRLRDGNTGTYTYDALNRLTRGAPPNYGYGDEAVTYTYDNLGRLLSAVNTINHHAYYSYDALGRVMSENNWPGTKTMAYDAAGRRTQLTWPDGFYVTYGYDTLGEMTSIKEKGSLTLATFAYDDLGNRTKLTRGNGVVTTYAHDPIGELSTLTNDLAGTAADHDITPVSSSTWN